MRRGLGHAMAFFQLLQKRITALEDEELDEAHKLLDQAVTLNPTIGPVPYPPTAKACHPTLANRCALCFGGLYDGVHEYVSLSDLSLASLLIQSQGDHRGQFPRIY